jgi:hypothetical protein
VRFRSFGWDYGAFGTGMMEPGEQPASRPLTLRVHGDQSLLV